MESNDKLEQLLRQMYAEQEDMDTSDIIDEEWAKFEAKHFGSKEAKSGKFSFLKIAAVFLGVLMLSGIAYAAYRIAVGGDLQSPTEETRISNSQQQDNQPPSPLEEPEKADSVHVFSNTPLDEMAGELAKYYHKVVDIRSPQAHELRLYYKWERRDKLESVVSDLNHFDHVNLTIEDDKLIVNP